MNGHSIEVLYEDNHLLAVVKPCNIPSQADETGDLDMLTLLKKDLKLRHQKPGNVFLGLVHRLDRPVGGVMVFAKTSKAAARLSEQIRNRSFKKIYLAVIHGVPKQAEGSLQHYLCKDPRTRNVAVVSQTSAGAQKAVLDYRLCSTEQGLSLVEVMLHTGRPHQIRVQFSAIGHPLYGDQRYGANLNRPGQQIALWSHRIQCQHPTQEQTIDLYASPPSDRSPWLLFSESMVETSHQRIDLD